MNQISLVTFRVAEQLLALPIDKVREVIRNVTISEAPPWSGLSHGIVNLRGSVIPVLDLRSVLAETPPSNTRKTRIIIVEMMERTSGLIVDEVEHIVPLSQEQMVPLSSLSWDKRTAILAGVAKIENKLYLVVDIDRLVHQEERNLFKEVCFRLQKPVVSPTS